MEEEGVRKTESSSSSSSFFERERKIKIGKKKKIPTHGQGSDDARRRRPDSRGNSLRPRPRGRLQIQRGGGVRRSGCCLGARGRGRRDGNSGGGRRRGRLAAATPSAASSDQGHPPLPDVHGQHHNVVEGIPGRAHRPPDARGEGGRPQEGGDLSGEGQRRVSLLARRRGRGEAEGGELGPEGGVQGREERGLLFSSVLRRGRRRRRRRRRGRRGRSGGGGRRGRGRGRWSRGSKHLLLLKEVPAVAAAPLFARLLPLPLSLSLLLPLSLLLLQLLPLQRLGIDAPDVLHHDAAADAAGGSRLEPDVARRGEEGSREGGARVPVQKLRRRRGRRGRRRRRRGRGRRRRYPLDEAAPLEAEPQRHR